MTAAELLRQTCNRYAQAAFYRDEGQVRMESANGAGSICARFRTMFARSRSLLWFDFIIAAGDGIKSARFTLEVLSGRVVTVHGINAPYPKTVGDATAAMAGITFGAIHIVPRMLLPDEVRGRMICAEPARFSEDVIFQRETERAVELDASRTLLRISLTDTTLREVRSFRDVSEQLRAAALSRGGDADTLMSWISSITYEPQIASLEPADLDLEFAAWISQWGTEL